MTDGTCSECGEVAKPSRRGFCGKCYKRWKRSEGYACLVRQCQAGAVAHGLCNAHYKKQRKYGDPLASSPRQSCAWQGCDKKVVISRSVSGLCELHAMYQWKRDNPDRVNASSRRYNDRNPDKKAAWQDKYRKANLAYFADRSAARHARKKAQFKEHVKRSVVFERDCGICGICGLAVDPKNWHLDHVVPLALGGEHSYANTQVTHPVCNLRKGANLLKASHHQES